MIYDGIKLSCLDGSETRFQSSFVPNRETGFLRLGIKKSLTLQSQIVNQKLI
jgi:hypothetical protein